MCVWVLEEKNSNYFLSITFFSPPKPTAKISYARSGFVGNYLPELASGEREEEREKMTVIEPNTVSRKFPNPFFSQPIKMFDAKIRLFFPLLVQWHRN